MDRPEFKKGTPRHEVVSHRRGGKGPVMTDTSPNRPTRFRTGGLSPRKPTRFDHEAGTDERKALAAELGLLALPRLRLTGEITPAGRDALELTARLQAEADQPCIITLAPVRARIDEAVRRRFVADLPDPGGDEIEMPADDSIEPMPDVIDLAEVAAEALALALPLYPRAEGAELGRVVHAAEGVAPLTDADLRPFAGLAALARKRPPEDGGEA
jgi:uncharacterized metal-binding protein YceD (DUF177 family)